MVEVVHDYRMARLRPAIERLIIRKETAVVHGQWFRLLFNGLKTPLVVPAGNRRDIWVSPLPPVREQFI